MTGSLPKKEDISLYIHIPFCAKKCPYCHFYVTQTKEQLKKLYLETLSIEWQRLIPDVQGRRLVSLYLGGGTPSQLNLEELSDILKMVFLVFPSLEIEEITIEINPEDSSLEFMQGLKTLGFTRISLGVQSLDPSLLDILGREHDAQKSIQAINDAYTAGIHNISIDLMYDIPHQTLNSWQNTLSRLKNLPITHLSLYNLTIEPHTSFYKHRALLTKSIPDDEVSLAMLNTAVEILENMGLVRYEISAFAKPGFHSRHNTGYWTGREFFGLGPSAFSFYKGARFQNIASINAYSQKLKQGLSPIDFTETLSLQHSLSERLAVQLRLLSGVYLDTFCAVWGDLSQEIHNSITLLHRDGFLHKHGSHIQLTEKGKLFYDSVASEILQ